MIIINKKKLIFIFTMFFLSVITFGANIINNTEIIEVSNILSKNKIIVIDAGHGQPDGGAVSKDGVEEEKLNLLIAKRLKEELQKEGYKVIMTREDEENIADDGVKNIKVSDLNNRVKIINESGADLAISIHMNKFTSEKYYGWQTFYSKNSKVGKDIAEKIQKRISQNIDRENKRVALSINNIKIVDKTNIPTVIVECGFLSNSEDTRLLQTEEYREKIVNGIVSRSKGAIWHIINFNRCNKCIYLWK